MQDINSVEIFHPNIKNPLIIDIDDYDKWQFFRDYWSYQKVYNRLWLNYQRSRSDNSKNTTIYLHRSIMGAIESSKVVDHVNGNGMDNRKCNLRIATYKQNSCNTKKRTGTTSKYKGVYFHYKSGRWIANIKINGKSTALGSFYCEEDAACAYDKKAREIQGEFARLNFNN